MKKLILTLTLSVIIMPLCGYSQSTVRQETAAFSSGESWRPINKFKSAESNAQVGSKIEAAQPLTNVLNGVSFYVKKSECNSQKAGLLKLINTNNYSVKVSWQLNPKSPISFITVPAMHMVEGSCTANNDIETTKLIIIAPTDFEKDNKKNKEFILSSITVAKE